MRWVGALKVLGHSTDKRPIWKDADLPVRFDVRPIVLLEPEHGIPMSQLSGKLVFYQTEEDAPGYKAFLRRSPNLFRRASDGELILRLLRQAEKQPVPRPVDPRKLARKPLFRVERPTGKTVAPAVVSVPEPEAGDEDERFKQPQTAEEGTTATRHCEIQHTLRALGAELGLDVWGARNDRSKVWSGTLLGEMPRMISQLPTLFNEATNRTIELIDVLWLKGNFHRGGIRGGMHHRRVFRVAADERPARPTTQP